MPLERWTLCRYFGMGLLLYQTRPIRQEKFMSQKILHHLAMPGESAEYRAARNKLLTEEMALRRQTESVAALRRALLRLPPTAEFALTDGFGVDGLGMPSLAMWKGDRVAACVAAASVVAKVTRDRIMTGWHEELPRYAFDIHKGYCTPLHQERLDEHGPSHIHRWCFENVRRTARPQASFDSPWSAGARATNSSARLRQS